MNLYCKNCKCDKTHTYNEDFKHHFCIDCDVVYQAGSEENKENYTKGITPTYYTGKYKGIKAEDIINDFELHHFLASSLEYILRIGKKDDPRQDVQKAINHLEMYKRYLNLKS